MRTRSTSTCAAESSISPAISTPRGRETRRNWRSRRAARRCPTWNWPCAASAIRLWRVPRGDLGGIAFDLAKRAITIERVEARPLSLRVVRQADGVVNFERLLRASARARSGRKRRRTRQRPEWSVVVRKLLFERMAADFEDQVPQPPVKLPIPEARIVAENLSNVRGAKGAIDFTARIGSGGRVHAAGPMVTQPFAIDWKVDVGGVDLLPLRPYFEAQTNVIVTSGALTAKGRLAYAGATSAGTGRGLRGRRDDQRLRRARPADGAGARPLENADADRRGCRRRAAESRARRDRARPVLRAAHRQPRRHPQPAAAALAARTGAAAPAPLPTRGAEAVAARRLRVDRRHQGQPRARCSSRTSTSSPTIRRT